MESQYKDDRRMSLHNVEWEVWAWVLEGWDWEGWDNCEIDEWPMGELGEGSREIKYLFLKSSFGLWNVTWNDK